MRAWCTAAEFDPSREASPPFWSISLFGRGPERFLAHARFSPPDFDHVIRLNTVSLDLTDQDLEQEVHVAIPDRRNAAGQRLREGQRVEGMLRKGTGAPAKVQFEVGKRIYFEEGELQVPPTFDQTDEEKRRLGGGSARPMRLIVRRMGRRTRDRQGERPPFFRPASRIRERAPPFLALK